MEASVWTAETGNADLSFSPGTSMVQPPLTAAIEMT